MPDNDYIYILYAVSADKNSEDDIKKNYKIYELQQKNPSKVDFDTFVEWKKMCRDDIKYNITRVMVACFLEKEQAMNAAENNFMDYNECGCYNYGLIEKLPIGAGYPDCCGSAEYFLYKFYRDEDKYKRIVNFRYVENAIMMKYNMMFKKS